MRQSELNEIELKLDADDQDEIAMEQRQTFLVGFEKMNSISDVNTIKKPVWPVAASVVAGNIANQFYSVASLFHADLRRMITKAIEEDRRIALEQFDEMD